jgi:hypothetical protein
LKAAAAGTSMPSIGVGEPVDLNDLARRSSAFSGGCGTST